MTIPLSLSTPSQKPVFLKPMLKFKGAASTGNHGKLLPLASDGDSTVDFQTDYIN
jgi:hypothetical protein